MAIIDTQKELIREKILLEKLQEGNFPSVSLIESLINEAFNDKQAGLPRFNFREMVKGQASVSADYNAMFGEIGEDLLVSFEDVKRLNNRIMSLANYYEGNRMKVNNALEVLELKAQALSMKHQQTTNITVVGDLIDNFMSVDFKGNESRNIPKTTAFVNLLQGDVEMARIKGGTIKHDLSTATIKFETDPDYNIINLTPFEAAVTDTIHDGWHSIVVTKEPVPVQATLTLELKDPVTASNITLDMQTGKPAYATLYLSSDGYEFTKFETSKIISSYQWVFESRVVKSIRFVIEKKEEDRPNGSEFEYIFGAKHIELVDVTYNDESYFVSKPFDLPDHEAVKRVSIEPDSYLPPDTSIRYYVGFDYGNNMIEWQELSKELPAVTDMVKPYETEINQFTTGYADLMYERFGTKFYRIAKLPHRPLKNSINLMMGRNMWLRETTPAPFDYVEVDDASDDIVYQTGIHDWVRTVSAKKNYLRIHNGFDYLKEGHFHRYTTNILAENPEVITATIRGSEDTSHAVILNGGQLKGVRNQYELHLQKGWNKIEVYAYARKINEEIILDFYIPNMNYEIFANKDPLTEVSLFDLLNNTSTRIHRRFAVDEDNNLIVNYDPKRLDIKGEVIQSATSLSPSDKTNTLSSGVEYALDYEYSTSDTKEHKIRLMAILSKESNKIQASPRLKGYKLLVE